MVQRTRRAAVVVAVVTLVATSCAESEIARPTGFPDSVTLREIDGGADFYARFSPSLPAGDDFFPVGLWASSVVDDTRWPTYRASGITTYVEPTPDSDPSLVADAGMTVLSSRGDGTNGRFTADEVDMWAGPGDAAWTGRFPGDGDVCEPVTAKCGYTVLDTLASTADDDALTYGNFGKSVLFWGTDEQSHRFVNDYQDVVSADAYWFTDPNICDASEGGVLLAGGTAVPEASCRRAENYGATVDRVRGLVDPPGSKPVWAFVEVGRPFENSPSSIRPRDMQDAVWSSVVHGARGVVFFNHSFGGDCRSQHVLLDCDPAMLDAVAVTAARLRDLAPVLAAPFADGLVVSSSVDATAKYLDGDFYVLAATPREGGRVSLGLACDPLSPIEVVGESRTVVAGPNGELEDDAAGGLHVYRATARECMSD
ncbi:hypothetical protein [Rhodococcoides kroppenstedtii]|uniref:hypothetical protein n=1 Tax=Rhodococcoides kroppenstedtii TaxID=293050 RepID=UPI0028E54854|nr:hypothetical protein [Rhodococcus kroppenstedtii]